MSFKKGYSMTLSELDIEHAVEILREPKSRRDLAYLILLLIPIGKVVSYSTLASILKTSPRAVARYLAHNRFAPLIPCHRVVKKNGDLGGYTPGGSFIKRKLLELEGVQIDDCRIPDHAFFDDELQKLIS